MRFKSRFSHPISRGSDLLRVRHCQPSAHSKEHVIISRFLAFLPVSPISHGPLFMLASLVITLRLSRAVLEVSYSEFSWSQPTLHLSDYAWPKQQVAATQQFHRLKRALNLSLDVAASKVSFGSSNLSDEADSFADQGPAFTIVLNSSLTHKSPRIRRIFTLYALLASSSRAFYLVRS